ncbi:hypothetical protein OGAPHI_004746 [Ogataea philodendri]|uniref:non-specific serine/threonine protein kinase n=1 Tax=Ogataea philodendri TaxID=1378263 RepID=A0A9P8P388_9ASCO|nr:uncharacterized protein OGAPHI_004746 [Ogataea philodendri]KAH3664032.1 hypothetical protein OGAPHI_004746 [Ogataea philodendri]
MSVHPKSPKIGAGLQIIQDKASADPPTANKPDTGKSVSKALDSPRIVETGTGVDKNRPSLSRPPSFQRFSDAAQKVGDYFSMSMANLHSAQYPTDSLSCSRSSSTASLGKLIETLHGHKKNTNLPLSPSKDNLAFLNRARRSSLRLEELDRLEDTPSPLPQVKETNYVKVEYDPITRKRILNTYEILKDLGSGQHGKVKLAKDLHTNELVAIKIVDRASKPKLGRLTRPGSSQEDKIRREIAIMKKCSHPHVVKLLEVLDAESSRKIYMVLEYLEKGEIQWQKDDDETDCRPEPLLSLSEAKNVFRDVVSGLEYLHNQGIIHRDIKPSNLLVSKDYVVKISDFGVSFAASLDGNNELELAKTAGTPAFLAPELCNTNGSCDKVTYKIDIWALGVTLYCLIFGCLPFNGETEFALFDNINTKPLSFPDTSQWKCSPPIPDYDLAQVTDLLDRLLQKNPDHRIEIAQIKEHPFFLEGLSRAQTRKYVSNWNNEMKIAVSTKEVDEAVVGIGNRIRKKISDVFRLTGLASPKPKQSLYVQSLKGLMTPSESDSSSNSSSSQTDPSYLLSESPGFPRGALKNSNSLSSPLIQTISMSPPKLVTRMSDYQRGTRNSIALSIESGTTESETKHNVDADSLIMPNHRGSSAMSQLSEIINTRSNPDSSNVPITESELTLTSDASESESINTSRSFELEEKPEPLSGNKTSLPMVPSFASLDSFYDSSAASAYETSIYTGIPSQRMPTTLGSRNTSGGTLGAQPRTSPVATRAPPIGVPLHTLDSAISVPESLRPDMDSISPAVTHESTSSRRNPAGTLAQAARERPRRNSRKVVFNNESENSSADESVASRPVAAPVAAPRHHLYGKRLATASAQQESESESDSDSDNSAELTLSFGANRSRPAQPRSTSFAGLAFSDTIHDVPLNLVPADPQTEHHQLIPEIGGIDLNSK